MIAVGFNPPTAARALQIKGTVLSLREPNAAELERAERHLLAFSAEVEQFGIPARAARRVFGSLSEFVLVTVAIEDVFDQTPGASAGERV